MPVISRFNGIVIKMYIKPKEHEPSHIHAIYGDYLGVFDIKSLEMTKGDLPIRIQKLVLKWLSEYKYELQKMWDSQQIGKLPPLA